MWRVALRLARTPRFDRLETRDLQAVPEDKTHPMKKRLGKPIRRDFRGHPHNRAIFETDVVVHPGSRLRVKLLVFRHNTDLNYFWTRGLGKCHLGRDCRGVVTELGHTVRTFHKDGSESSRREVDPRYVAIVGLLKDYLGCEVLSHESVHVGFAWADRFGGARWPSPDHDDEQVCYPTGRFFAEAVKKLRKANLIP